MEIIFSDALIVDHIVVDFDEFSVLITTDFQVQELITFFKSKVFGGCFVKQLDAYP